MDDTAMRELAQHIMRTIAIHEASWVSGFGFHAYGEYAKSYDQAMAEAMVPEPLQMLVYVLASHGVCEITEWCERTLNPYGLDVSPGAQVATV